MTQWKPSAPHRQEPSILVQESLASRQRRLLESAEEAKAKLEVILNDCQGVAPVFARRLDALCKRLDQLRERHLKLRHRLADSNDESQLADGLADLCVETEVLLLRCDLLSRGFGPTN